jgi:uncharacterized membrane protein
MSDDERLARLEQRLAVLEMLVRQLASQRGPAGADAITQPRTVGPRAPALPPRSPLPPPPELEERERLLGDSGASAAPSEPSRPRSRSAPLFTEEWLGQKGLLAVGVIFLVLAAGYLLKLSFDREWISPAARCVGGAVVGAVVAALGWRLHHKGTRTYGAALIGAGAAIIYLAVWAAAKRYEFLPPGPAIISLALIAVGLAAIAYALNLQALGAAAAIGAFLAPIVIGREAGNANLLLLYLGSAGAGLGGVSAIRRWRIALFIVALSYFGFATSSLLAYANGYAVYAYGILGGAAGLYVALREGWFETRFLAFAGGWGVLAVADRNAGLPWLTLLGGILLTVPVWWRAITHGRVWPDHPERQLPAFGDSFYFYFSPMLLGAALAQVAPDTFRDHPGLVPALLGLPYLLVGLAAVRRPFAIVGAVGAGAAAIMEWSPQQSSLVLLGLAVFWAGIERILRRDDAQWYSLATYAVSLGTLLLALDHRPGSTPAFVDPWALSLWAEIGFAVVAARLWQASRPGWTPLLWTLAGSLLLFGGTAELWRHFGDQGGSALAGGLAVSAWWILFAGACFLAGFRLRLKPLRTAGFLVAGCALAKVLLVDLSTLDAFYRIGSALILGLVCLAVAYIYHRSRTTGAVQ